MKLHASWITAIALCLAACGAPEQPEPGQAEVPETPSPAAETAPRPEAQVDQAFLDHMHAHADQLDELMFALADDDLEAALTPAYWLSKHDTVSGIPDEWRQFVVGMRESASAVETAADLETARAAAEQISAHCQDCHAAAGINVLE